MLNDPAFLAKLAEWQAEVTKIQAMAPTIAREKQLRQEVFALAFPVPKEGTNNGELPQGWAIKGTLKIDRKIDQAVLPKVMEHIREVMKFNVDAVVKFTPELVTKEYKAMPEEVRKTFDTALTIKPALPAVEIIPPKAAS